MGGGYGFWSGTEVCLEERLDRGRGRAWVLLTYDFMEARLLTGLESKCSVIPAPHSYWSLTVHQDPYITFSSDFLLQRRNQIAQVLTIALAFFALHAPPQTRIYTYSDRILLCF